jgi:hypothetical protein
LPTCRSLGIKTKIEAVNVGEKVQHHPGIDVFWRTKNGTAKRALFFVALFSPSLIICHRGTGDLRTCLGAVASDEVPD